MDVKKKVDEVFKQLKSHPHIMPFLTNEIEPNLFTIENQKYKNTYNIGLEIRKMFSEGFKKFSNDQTKYAQIMQLSQFFEAIFSEVDNKPLHQEEAKGINELNRKVESILKEIRMKGGAPSREGAGKMDKRMSPKEIQKLGEDIGKLNQNQLKGLIDIVKQTDSFKNNSG